MAAKKSFKKENPNTVRALFVRSALLIILVFALEFLRITYDQPTLIKSLEIAVFVVGLSIFFILAASTLVFAYLKKRRLAHDHVDNFTVGIHKVAGVAFWIIALLYTTDAAIIELSELLTSITIIIALVGMMFRDHLVNFINGVTIMFTGKFRLGEFVRIGDHKGKIVDLTFMHTELLTETKDVIYVPNNLIFTREVINFSRSLIKNIHVNITVDRVHYGQYPALRKKITTKVMAAYPDMVTEKDRVQFRIESMDKDSMTWTIQFLVDRYNFVLEKKLRNLVAEIVAEHIAKIEQKA